MIRLSAPVRKLMDELDEAAVNRAAVSSKSSRIGYVGSDFFIGIKVPEIRKVAERYAGMSLAEIERLLDSEVHEHRMCALVILKNNSNKEMNANGKQFLIFISVIRTA